MSEQDSYVSNLPTGPDQSLMYDGMTEEEVEAYKESTFNTREMSRLWAFNHIVRQSNDLEARLNAGTAQEMWWVPQDSSQKKSLLWKESWGMLHSLRKISLNMYAGHNITKDDGTVSRVPGFIDDEKMKEAADQMLNVIHNEKVGVAIKQKQAIADMWDYS